MASFLPKNNCRSADTACAITEGFKFNVNFKSRLSLFAGLARCWNHRHGGACSSSVMNKTTLHKNLLRTKAQKVDRDICSTATVLCDWCCRKLISILPAASHAQLRTRQANLVVDGTRASRKSWKRGRMHHSQPRTDNFTLLTNAYLSKRNRMKRKRLKTPEKI